MGVVNKRLPGRKIEMKDGGVKYTQEVELPNGHKWRKRLDGGWCRFSKKTCYPAGKIRKTGLTSGKSKRAKLKDFFSDIKSKPYEVLQNRDNKLPKFTNGKKVTYKEYDFDRPPTDLERRIAGADRGTRRIVVGSDGRAYYTNNHYDSFVRIL